MVSSLYDKEIKCPVCDAKFNTKKVRTQAVKMEKRDSDFCSYYAGENPAFYGVYVCPKCGYSSFESDFPNITQAQKAQVRKSVSANWSGTGYGDQRSLDDAIEAHKMVLLNYQVMEYEKSAMAKACLRLGWFYRMKGDEEKEKQFLTYAADFYEKAFTTENIEDASDPEVVILYMLGELNRRLERLDKSVRWFDMALRHPDLKDHPQVESRVRDQRLQASEEYRKQKAKEQGNDGDQ